MINKNKRPMDYKVGDRVLVLTGDYENRVGTVQGHYGDNLIVSFEKETNYSPIHYAEVVKWFEKV